MSRSPVENSYTVLFPAFADLRLSDQAKKFLDRGGCSILLGESRQEYVSREMSAQRIREERAEHFRAVVDEARSRAGSVIAAVDQEPGGICRLHRLVPAFPPMTDIAALNSTATDDAFAAVASAAGSLGVNCFLAPILDCVTGDNPWLAGRTWSTDPTVIAELSARFIRAVQGQGIAAVAKHFPGYAHLPLDPAVEAASRNVQDGASFADGFIPFKAAIEADVEVIMTGLAIVDTFDPEHAAAVSPSVNALLKQQLGFAGLVMSDDLDSAATLRSNSITETAVQALQAGADLLLIADTGDQVAQVADAVTAAVENGILEEQRLAEAAATVRRLVRRYSL